MDLQLFDFLMKIPLCKKLHSYAYRGQILYYNRVKINVTYVYKLSENFEIEKGSRDCNKSKETSS